MLYIHGYIDSYECRVQHRVSGAASNLIVYVRQALDNLLKFFYLLLHDHNKTIVSEATYI